MTFDPDVSWRAERVGSHAKRTMVITRTLRTCHYSKTHKRDVLGDDELGLGGRPRPPLSHPALFEVPAANQAEGYGAVKDTCDRLSARWVSGRVGERPVSHVLVPVPISPFSD